MNKKSKKIKELKETLFLTNRYGGDMFYPPAVLWKKNISIKQAKETWQKAANDVISGKVSSDLPGLYVHIPFCQSKCFYCNCVSVSAADNELHGSYLDCLEKEIKALALPHAWPIKTFCVGGGTPTILSEGNLEKMLGMMAKFFNFSQCEQAMMEASPGTISPAKIRIFKDFGIDKITLGVQTLDENLLAKMNRQQDKKMVWLAFEQLRKEKIKYINIDLMAGLPGQTINSFLATLREVLTLKPDTIHLNPFTPLFFTPFALGGNKLRTKDLAARLEMIKQGFELIRQIHPWALEREGLEKENQQLFNTANFNSSVLGLGWGALSHAFSRLQYGKDNFIENYQNINQGLKKYIRTLGKGGWPLFFGCSLSKEEEMRVYLIRAFESGGMVKKNSFQNIFQENPFDIFPREFAELEKIGVIEENNGNLRLRAKSRLDLFVFSRVFFSSKAAGEIKKIIKRKKFDLGNIDEKLEINFCNELILN
jgi:oxygen-independent coproporphyrinogen-3 oxidase